MPANGLAACRSAPTGITDAQRTAGIQRNTLTMSASAQDLPARSGPHEHLTGGLVNLSMITNQIRLGFCTPITFAMTAPHPTVNISLVRPGRSLPGHITTLRGAGASGGGPVGDSISNRIIQNLDSISLTLCNVLRMQYSVQPASQS